MREKISGCVTAGNEERNIRRCLESMKWCDEIVVIDSFSRDRTVKICCEYTPRVYQHQWMGYIAQKNLVRQMAQHPWVLILDADEEISPRLRAEIEAAMEKDGDRYAGYEFPRLVFYMGRWIRHGDWYPDIKLRLFKRELGHTEGREPHDHVVVRGAVRTLHNPIYHYTYDDIADHLDTVNRFSTITAVEKFREGVRFRWTDFLFRPGWRFLRAYFVKLGFLDGRRGLLIAVISAFGVQVKYAKLWELELNARRGDSVAASEPPAST